MSEDKSEHYKKYGWKVNEDNLRTLPSGAPRAAKDLAKWLTLEGRRSSLQEWLNVLDTDGKIHGKYWHIGAWTQRMSHSNPNQANIPAILGKDPETPVEEVKAEYNGRMRELFEADKGAHLVGCDAEGIQLRILCHYMESADYRDAILSGDKKLKTDIHSLNQRALGPICKSRDDAKTFIYAWILGAGIPKIASILGCSNSDASKAVSNFLASLPELDRLKKVDVVTDAARGFFVGLDGRRVPCNSKHLMLAGYLQNGEAVIMKHANILWYKQLKEQGYDFKQVNFVHDEWQTVVYGGYSKAEEVGRIQAQAIKEVGKRLKLYCELDGKAKVGRNWKETH